MGGTIPESGSGTGSLQSFDGWDGATYGTPKTPASPSAAAGDHWGSAAATPPLWGASGEPSAADLVQGGLGDCYVDSDLQHLATANPDYLKDHIQVVSSGATAQDTVYGVSLFDASGKPITVYVNGQQMLDSSSNTVGTGQNALWPAIYEKAIAVAQGEDMDTLGSGGIPSVLWQTLTGSSGTDIDGLPSPDQLQQLTAGSTGIGFGIGTLSDPQDLPGWNGSSALIDERYLVTVPEDSGSVAIVYDTSSNTEGWALPLGHAMAITGVDNSNVPGGTDPTLVNLNVENPWGATATNNMNLQGVPYPVVKALTNYSYELPIPQAGSSHSGSGS